LDSDSKSELRRRNMKRVSNVSLMVWLLLAVLTNVPPALAQVTITGEIVGTVQDQSGAVVPDVKLQLQDEATKAIRTTTSGADGGFVFVSLKPGNYDLTATKEGFQTAVYTGIVVNTARTTNQTVTLMVGKVAQTVTVEGAAPVLQTTATTLSSTVETKGLNDLPLAGRAVLPFALLMPGVQRTTSDRDSTINGLPGGAINVTFDGINNSSQRFKTAGTSFWAFTNPQLESVAEITVSTSNLGGNSAGQGAMQIQMVPRSGTNTLHGELFEQHQNAALNANTWFNNARGTKRPGYILNNFGFAVGGPILRNKLFFFAGYGQSNQPSSVANESWFLTPLAQSGTFTYTGTDGNTYTANLLPLAGAAGLPSTIDPIIAAQQEKINASLSAVPPSAISSVDANINDVRWVQPASFLNQYPTLRLDYNVTDKIRLNATAQYWHRNLPNTTPPPFPGSGFKQFSYGFASDYYIADAGFTWMLRPNLTNEVKLGVQSNRENFNTGAVITQFLPRCLNWPLGLSSGIDANVQNTCWNAPWIRNNPVYNLVDNLSWVRGSHTVTAGGDVLRTTMYETSWGLAGIPAYNFGIASGDPAGSLFTTLPAISSDDLSYAQTLYALLTGRVSSVYSYRNINEKTHQYADLAPNTDREKLVSFGLYLQDSWRVNRSLTLDYGLRWDFQGDDENTNGIYSSPTLADLFGPSGAGPSGAANLFNPGSFLGIQNPNIWQRSKTYNRDYINPAPHLGIAWNPSFGEGLRKRLFGDRKTVFRGGFAINYYGEDMINFQTAGGYNPGRSQSESLYPGMPGFAPGGLSVSSPMPPFGVYPESFSFPIPLSDFTFWGTWIYTTNPNLHAPYVQNWSAGMQRELTDSTVLEVRYVGNRGVHLWHQYNLNEVNIFENGFLKEFLAAQKNLAINGGASFADTGAPGLTATPIFDAAFAGLSSDIGYANGSFISMLQTGQAGGLASSLAGSYYYLCNLLGTSFSPCAYSGSTGTYPINFFQLNPYMAGGAAQMLSDDSYSTYNGLQAELRRKLARGLTFDVNCTWSHTLTDRNNKNIDSSSNWTTLRNLALNKAPSPWDIRHTFQGYGTYDLPFGRGRRFSVSNSIANQIVGGWTVGGIFRVRSGVPFELSSGRYTFNDEDSGVALASGVTASKLQSMVGTYRSGQPQIFFVDPAKLKGSDGRANTDYLMAPTAPGQLGSFVYLYGPKLVTTDLSVSKQIRITERYRLVFQSEFLNAFNHPDFQNSSVYVYGVSPVSIRSTTFGRTTTTAVGPRNIQFRLRFLF
jgi:hypothetical protein